MSPEGFVPSGLSYPGVTAVKPLTSRRLEYGDVKAVIDQVRLAGISQACFLINPVSQAIKN